MVETGILEIEKLEAGAPHADDIVAEQGRAERVTGAPLLRTLVFAGGFASIGVELTASRLLAPYFGNSTFIWASRSSYLRMRSVIIASISATCRRFSSVRKRCSLRSVSRDERILPSLYSTHFAR